MARCGFASLFIFRLSFMISSAQPAPVGQQASAVSSAVSGAAQKPLALPTLPALREDLVLFASSDNPDGSPTWAVQDPVRNKFIQIGWLEFEMLSRWQESPLEVMKSLAADTPLRPSLEDVMVFAHFLRQQNLVRLDSREDLAKAREAPTKPGISNWHWWLHNYLFFRIPLARPDRLLSRLTPKLNWLVSPLSMVILSILCLGGALLAWRQSELFFQTFVDSLTLSGLVSFAFALAMAKTLHEAGHAFVATHYGVRVAHMGVAFLVLWPMLYTDTSESWRLRDHRQRLKIAAAGMSVEMLLAGLSLLGWALTPPGALRSAFFYLATTSLVMTLALNISPFMRFDGYYVLSDALDMPNLHERSGALAKTWVRRTFLGWQDPWPEHFDSTKHNTMICFALGTWIYRFFLFLGIAVAVYLMFFKLLGIFLFIVEIVWFILRPLYTELKIWHARRLDTQRGRARLWLLLLIAGLGLFAFPWAHDIHAPALMRTEYRTIYSPIAGKIVMLRQAGQAAQGEALVALDSAKLRSDAQRAQINADATQAALTTAEIGPEQNRDQVARLGQTIQQYQAEDKAAGQELARMQLGANFTGRWTDIDPTLRVGSWVRPQDPIGTLINDASWTVEAWVEEQQVQHIRPGSVGRFYAANRVDAPLKVTVLEVDTVRASSLPHPGMSTDHGGSIPTVAGAESRGQVPREAMYLVRLQLEGKPEQIRWTRGKIVVNGERHSKLLQAVSYAGSVLIRESGF
jgi:putative peptide zinc metalloprotease protein